MPSATAVLFALAVLRFGATAQVGAYLYLAGVGVVLAMVDLNTRRLPDVVVLPSYIAVLGLLLLAAAGDGSGLLRALAGCGVLVVFYFTLALARPGAMGLGDVKLAGVLGLALGWLGWGPLLVGTVAAFVLGSLVGAGLLVTRRARVGRGMPFGPAMLIGAGVGIGFGEQLTDAYLSLLSL